jgi:hypothetical protein
VSPVRYKLGVISQKTEFHSHCHENHKSYIALNGWVLWRRHNVFPVRYELGYIPEDGILHGHCRESLKTFIALNDWAL